MTLGWGMEPQLDQSGTPAQSSAGEGAHPNSLMPNWASWDVPTLIVSLPGLHSAPLQAQEAEKPPRMQGLGWQPAGKDRLGLHCRLWKRAIFSHLSF